MKWVVTVCTCLAAVSSMLSPTAASFIPASAAAAMQLQQHVKEHQQSWSDIVGHFRFYFLLIFFFIPCGRLCSWWSAMVIMHLGFLLFICCCSSFLLLQGQVTSFRLVIAVVWSSASFGFNAFLPPWWRKSVPYICYNDFLNYCQNFVTRCDMSTLEMSFSW